MKILQHIIITYKIIEIMTAIGIISTIYGAIVSISSIIGIPFLIGICIFLLFGILTFSLILFEKIKFSNKDTKFQDTSIEYNIDYNILPEGYTNTIFKVKEHSRKNIVNQKIYRPNVKGDFEKILVYLHFKQPLKWENTTFNAEAYGAKSLQMEQIFNNSANKIMEYVVIEIKYLKSETPASLKIFITEK